MTDAERLDWLEELSGAALISDDCGHWAVVHDGLQNVPENPPADVYNTFFIDKELWCGSVRGAIDADRMRAADQEEEDAEEADLLASLEDDDEEDEAAEMA